MRLVYTTYTPLSKGKSPGLATVVETMWFVATSVSQALLYQYQETAPCTCFCGKQN
jgi:hypothetical protein